MGQKRDKGLADWLVGRGLQIYSSSLRSGCTIQEYFAITQVSRWLNLVRLDAGSRVIERGQFWQAVTLIDVLELWAVLGWVSTAEFQKELSPALDYLYQCVVCRSTNLRQNVRSAT